MTTPSNKPTSLRTLYPSDQGWIRLELTLKTADRLSDEQLRKLVTLGRVEEYEIPYVSQSGRKIVAYSRHQSRKPSEASA